MKKNWFRMLAIMMLALVLALTGCSENKNSGQTEDIAASQQQKDQEEQHIVVKIQDGKKVISEKEIKIEKGDNLLDIMKENFKIEEEDNFVTSIDGVAQDEKKGKYWVFEINGKAVNEGAHLTEVKNNDEVVWMLKKFK